MIRVLIITPAFRPNLGGVEVHLTDLTEYLRNHDYFCYVLTYQPITTKEKGKPHETDKNIEIHRFNWFSGNYFNDFVPMHPIFNFLYLTPYLFIRTFMFMIFNAEKVDVIHAIGLSTAFSARIIKLIFSKPAVMSTETLFNFKKGTMFASVCKWVLSGMDGILAQSDESKSELVDLGIDPKKITVFSHWINQDIFTPVNDKKIMKKKLGWKNKFTLLYVGRLIPEKGIVVLLDCMSKLGSQVELKIVGDDGPMLPAVLEAQKKYPNITFLGKIPHEKLPPVYQASDLFVYPALYKEDMAYSILDSLSCGTPVINSNPGSGIYRLSKEVAVVLDPTPKNIVKTIKYLQAHPKILGQMSKKSGPFASRFGPSLAKKITNMYDSTHAKFEDSR